LSSDRNYGSIVEVSESTDINSPLVMKLARLVTVTAEFRTSVQGKSNNTFKTWERYGIEGLGTIVLINPDGRIVEGDESTLQEILDKAKQ
jgi:hypothetical protein